MTIRIGITGPIGCGKSTVAHWLGERLGVVVVDADHEARLVLAPETPEVEAVYARFGATLRRPNGELDRAELVPLLQDRGEIHVQGLPSSRGAHFPPWPARSTSSARSATSCGATRLPSPRSTG